MQLFRHGTDETSTVEVEAVEPATDEHGAAEHAAAEHADVFDNSGPLREERDQLIAQRNELVAAHERLIRDRNDLLSAHEQLLHEHDELREELSQTHERMRRLAATVERYQEHAQRTSKLFIHATDYAARVRESARRDAELALRKSRARADEVLADVVRERARTEREILRLRALARETRTRLTEITVGALRSLDPSEPAAPLPEDLPDALRRELAASRDPRPTTDFEQQEEGRGP